MEFHVDENARALLELLKEGFSEIRVSKIGLYPGPVSFLMADGQVVSLRAASEDIAPKYEVFPLWVENSQMDLEPEIVIKACKDWFPAQLSVLRKAEWQENLAEEQKEGLFGDTNTALGQCEGKPSDVPSDVGLSVTLDAGIHLEFANRDTFSVATSMFPLSMYVSNCDFSEEFDMDVYELIPL